METKEVLVIVVENSIILGHLFSLIWLPDSQSASVHLMTDICGLIANFHIFALFSQIEPDQRLVSHLHDPVQEREPTSYYGPEKKINFCQSSATREI